MLMPRNKYTVSQWDFDQETDMNRCCHINQRAWLRWKLGYKGWWLSRLLKKQLQIKRWKLILARMSTSLVWQERQQVWSVQGCQHWCVQVCQQNQIVQCCQHWSGQGCQQIWSVQRYQQVWSVRGYYKSEVFKDDNKPKVSVKVNKTEESEDSTTTQQLQQQPEVTYCITEKPKKGGPVTKSPKRGSNQDRS